MNTKTIEKPKSYLFRKILWVLLITALGAAAGIYFNNIPGCTIGGLIGGSAVFFLKKKN